MNTQNQKVILALPVQSSLHHSRANCLEPFKKYHDREVEIRSWKFTGDVENQVAEVDLIVSPDATEPNLQRVAEIRRIRAELTIFLIAAPLAAQRLWLEFKEDALVTIFADERGQRWSQVKIPEGLPLLNDLYQRTCVVLGLTAATP